MVGVLGDLYREVGREGIDDRDGRLGDGHGEPGEEHRRGQVEEADADEEPRVLAHERLENGQENEGQEKDRPDLEHEGVVALKPGRREIDGRRRVDRVGDLAQEPRGAIADPACELAEDRVTRCSGRGARRVAGGAADDAHPRHVARPGEIDRLGAVRLPERKERGHDQQGEQAPHRPEPARRGHGAKGDRSCASATNSPGALAAEGAVTAGVGPGVSTPKRSTLQRPPDQTSSARLVDHAAIGLRAGVANSVTCQIATVARRAEKASTRYPSGVIRRTTAPSCAGCPRDAGQVLVGPVEERVELGAIGRGRHLRHHGATALAACQQPGIGKRRQSASRRSSRSRLGALRLRPGRLEGRGRGGERLREPGDGRRRLDDPRVGGCGDTTRARSQAPGEGRRHRAGGAVPPAAPESPWSLTRSGAGTRGHAYCRPIP